MLFFQATLTLSVTIEKDLDPHQYKRATTYTARPSWWKADYAAKIRNLESVETVREWIMEGVPYMEIARRIQEELGEATHLSRNYLQDCVSHYRHSIPPWVFIAKTHPKKYLKAVQAAEKGVDVVKELTELFLIQKKRVEIGFKREQQFGLLSQGMEKNMQVAAALLEKLADLKDKLGLSVEGIEEGLAPHMAKEVDWKRVYGRESVQKVLENPESRSRVVQVAERLLDLYAPKLADAESYKKTYPAATPATPSAPKDMSAAEFKPGLAVPEGATVHEDGGVSFSASEEPVQPAPVVEGLMPMSSHAMMPDEEGWN